VAHKPDYVAGVVGPGPLGIDIEPSRQRSPNLFAKIADPAEWALGSEAQWQLFYRFWTAKEAVLKAVGVGLRGLSDCRVVHIDAADCLTLAFRGQLWRVRQRFFHGHWAALACGAHPVEWHWPDLPAEAVDV
jgi:4'-phosphopantetheinyl transferase